METNKKSPTDAAKLDDWRQAPVRELWSTRGASTQSLRAPQPQVPRLVRVLCVSLQLLFQPGKCIYSAKVYRATRLIENSNINISSSPPVLLCIPRH